jgi:hypothetical protein
MMKSIDRHQQSWTQHQWVRLIAGSVVLISLSLSLINPTWLWLTAFVGLNLLQSAFTDLVSVDCISEKAGCESVSR